MILRSIQYLRGVAAMLIVFYHLFVQLDRLGYTGQAPQFLSIGVDIFFVISGFIMWYTTFDGKLNTSEFLRHRVVRIVPLYWLITSFYVLVLLTYPTLMQSGQYDLYHIIASYLFIPAPHPLMHAMWPLVDPGWTLNYEMLFYLLFGLSLALPSGPRVLAIVSMLVCLVFLRLFHPTPNSILGFYSSSIVLEFAFGVLIGYFYTRSVVISRFWSIAIMVCGVVLAVGSVEIFPGAGRVIVFGVPALLIVGGAMFFERNGHVKQMAFPKLLGDASYSLYLSHGAVLSAIYQIWRALSLPPVSQPITLFLFSTISIAIATAAGICIYKFVERPLVQNLSILFKKSNNKTFGRAFNR